MTAKILLVGAGNIGRRHLQAMLRIAGDKPIGILVVEPSEAGRAETRKVLEAAAADPTRAARAPAVRLEQALPETTADIDLAVIATGAGPRRAIFEEIEKRGGSGAYIFEKVLFVRTRDLDEVGAALAARATPAWVNCARRLSPSYRALRTHLLGHGDMRMRVAGSRYNLASNAVHFTDLLSFLTGDRLVALSTEGLEPGSRPSRHACLIELFGTLAGDYAAGGRIEMICRAEGDEPTVIEIEDGATRWVIRESKGTITRIDAAGETTEPFGMPYVSESPWPYEDVLARRDCSLTPYAESAGQHRLFIDAVRSHLGLSIAEDAACPIT